MLLPGLWQAISHWPLAQFISESDWAFPTFESIHVIAITTVIGTIAVMDLRLLGLASNRWPVTLVSHDTLRWTWGAFGLALVTGSLLFISKAPDYANNPWFNGKMVLMALAGVNMAVFHLRAWPKVAKWDANVRPPLQARLAGGLSLAFWIVVVFLGREVGFTLDKFSPS
jgi:hypothetical protein